MNIWSNLFKGAAPLVLLIALFDAIFYGGAILLLSFL